MPRIYFVGVDVGTTSARAALVNSQGRVIKQYTENIKIWNPSPDCYEQSSNNIWKAVCECVQDVIKGVPIEEIVGISFDATCSLVVLGENGHPISVSQTGEPEQNIILWMDHRAQKEMEEINSTQHDLLKFVGGQVSLEMQMPKLLWLKRNLYASCYEKIWRVFDLPDFLTWKSTGNDTRSLCSVVCKWNYDAINNCWSEDYLRRIDLGELCLNNFEKIGSNIVEPGAAIGNGLTFKAASELGLMPHTYVGASLIDAHAGALGLFGCNPTSEDNNCLVRKLALVCGTSTCHMSLTKEPCWTRGVWGPYKSAIIPNYFLNEGGQSATGVLLDFVLSTHPKYHSIKEKLKIGEHISSYLYRFLVRMTKKRKLPHLSYLTKDIHVWPDLHGNRSPLADSTLKGMISGIDMTLDEENLALIYLAFVQALSYGTRHIIESVEAYGRPKFSTLLFCGGLSKNNLYVQMHADICNLPAVVPNESEMVLVGASILGACAAKVYPNLETASKAMGGSAIIIPPNKETIEYHDRKYKVFMKMLEDQRSYKGIMNECVN